MCFFLFFQIFEWICKIFLSLSIISFFCLRRFSYGAFAGPSPASAWHAWRARRTWAGYKLSCVNPRKFFFDNERFEPVWAVIDSFSSLFLVSKLRLRSLMIDVMSAHFRSLPRLNSKRKLSKEEIFPILFLEHCLRLSECLRFVSKLCRRLECQTLVARVCLLHQA